jgi:hypothetical protein
MLRLNKTIDRGINWVSNHLVEPLNIARLVLWVGVRWLFSQIHVSALLSLYLTYTGFTQFYIFSIANEPRTGLRFITETDSQAIGVIIFYFAMAWLVGNWKHPASVIMASLFIILYGVAVIVGTSTGDISYNGLLAVADKFLIAGVMVKSALTSYEATGTFREMFEVLAGTEAYSLVFGITSYTDEATLPDDRANSRTNEGGGG